MVDYINHEQKLTGEPEITHDNFLKKVPQVLGGDAVNFNAIYLDSVNRQKRSYTFPKREACLMAMSYSYDLQAKVFDHMTKLESERAGAPKVARYWQLIPFALRTLSASTRAAAAAASCWVL